MSPASPAIVSRDAARRLPRWALWALCAAYVLAGFFGRSPWRGADITAFGHMLAAASTPGTWWSPAILDQAPDAGAPLVYGLGAAVIHLSAPLLAPDLAVRSVFAALLGLTLTATWYGIYHLARQPAAQPVAFAFGGEASPGDYARAVADGGLLALLACLGLAQLSHETTPAVVQLTCSALALLGTAALARRPLLAAPALWTGVAGLSLSGAPTVALGVAAIALLVQGWLVWRAAPLSPVDTGLDAPQPAPATRTLATASAIAALALALLLPLGVQGWPWRLDPPQDATQWASTARLLLWFGWPAWPLAAWTLWRWRGRLGQVHVALPLLLVALTLVSAVVTRGGDRALLPGLPALAALAAFALPTLRRSIGALIDWFTLLFFTGCAALIWLFWVAMQTGSPQAAARRIERLYGGFEPDFQPLALLLATLATVAWALLVAWRVGRNRHPIWKSLALPAGGAALCWLLLTTLWLPLLDHVRSYRVMAARVAETVRQAPGCVLIEGLNPGQTVALGYHASLPLKVSEPADGANRTEGTPCPWLVAAVPTERQQRLSDQPAGGGAGWRLQRVVRSSTEREDEVAVFRRVGP